MRTCNAPVVARAHETGGAAGAGAGPAAQLAAGPVARLMMRLATVAGDGGTSFSLGGTAAIVVMFVAAAVPGAILAPWRTGGVRPRWSSAPLLCLAATASRPRNLGHLSGLSTLRWVGVGLATLGVYAAILAMPWVAQLVLALRRV